MKPLMKKEKRRHWDRQTDISWLHMKKWIH